VRVNAQRARRHASNEKADGWTVGLSLNGAPGEIRSGVPTSKSTT